MTEKEPEMGIPGPKWWHPHGIKMGMRNRKNGSDPLIIESGAAYLKITRSPSGGFTVKWKITHNPSSDVEGKVFFTEKELGRAFALSDESSEHGNAILKKYGGTAAGQGTFIRYENYLNIPCPGTGHDGDPNISIKLNEEIIEAVHHLLYGSHQ